MTEDNYTLSEKMELLQGYLAIYNLIRVEPWLEKNYDNLTVLRCNVTELSRDLLQVLNYSSLNQCLGASVLSVILDTAHECQDESLLQDALDDSSRLLYPEVKGKDQIRQDCGEIAGLLYRCYYHTEDIECLWSVQSILDLWKNNMDINGSWKGLGIAEALKRLAVLDLYGRMDDDEEYVDCLERGKDYYQNLLLLQQTTITLKEQGSVLYSLLGLESFGYDMYLSESFTDIFARFQAVECEKNATEDRLCYFSVIAAIERAKQYHRMRL